MYDDAEPYSLLHSHLMQSPPRLWLWHFTSAAGLDGIVTSATIRASNAKWLNDTTEQSIAWELMLEHLRHVKLSGNFYDTAEEWAIDQWLNDPFDHDYPNRIYTASFTEQREFDRAIRPDVHEDNTTPDVLTMWQAYSPSDGGFAFGVTGDHLKIVGADQGFYLARCIYRRDQARQIMSEVVETCRKIWQSPETPTSPGMTRGTWYPLSRKSRFFTQLSRATLIFAPVFKHPTFEHEQEWRLIGLVEDDDPRLCVRSTARELIPYVPIKLMTATTHVMEGPPSQGPGAAVFIGPRSDYKSGETLSPMQKRAYHGVQLLFRDSGLDLGWISASNVPFRGMI